MALIELNPFAAGDFSFSVIDSSSVRIRFQTQNTGILKIEGKERSNSPSLTHGAVRPSCLCTLNQLNITVTVHRVPVFNLDV